MVRRYNAWKESKTIKDLNKDDDSSSNVSYFDLYRYCNRNQKILVIFGIIVALANGLPMPILLLVYGRTVDNFVVTQFCDILNTVNISKVCPPFVDDTNINEYFHLCNWTGLNITLPNLGASISQRSIEFVIIGIASWILSWLQTSILSHTAENIIRNVRCKLFKSVLMKPVSWFDNHSSGSINSILNETTEKFKNGIGDKVGMVSQGILVTIASIIISIISGWKLGLVMLSSAPFIIVIIAFLTKKMTKGTGTETKAYNKAGSVAQDTFANIRTVHAYNGTGEMQKLYGINLDIAYKQALIKGMFLSFAVACLWLIIFLSYSLGFWYGGKLAVTDGMSIGSILIIFFGIQTAVFTIGGNVPHYSSITESRSAAFTIYKTIDEGNDEQEKYDDKLNLQKSSTSNFIEFENVIFSYPSRKEITTLDDVSFTIKKGSTVAIVGESGCGKSTIIQMLLGFYHPNVGIIRINGIPIQNINVNELRKSIGLVSQEPVLFSTTIRENIRLAKLDATDDEIHNACELANAIEFITSFPDKFNTLVGEGGSQLSGGQKQRIAIARALVANPPILLLDEATSALDTESEKVVQQALDTASQGRTTLIIAHRLSTIRNADIIIGISNGKIVESGTHEHLMGINGVYQHLVEAQYNEKQTNENRITKPEKAMSILKSNRAVSTMSVISESEDSIEKEENITKKVMVYMMKLNSPEMIYMIIGTIGVVIWGVLQVLFQIFFAHAVVIFSNCNEKQREEYINLKSLRFLIIGIALFICQFGGLGSYTISGERLTKRIRTMLFKTLTKQEIGFFDQKDNGVGKICTMLSTEASSIQGATGIRIGTTLSSFAILFVGLVVALVYGWQLALVILAFVPILIGAGIISMKVITGFAAGDKKYLEEAGRIIVEITSNIRTVKQLRSENYFIEKYTKIMDHVLKRNLNKTIITGGMFGFSQGVVFFALAACYYSGAKFIEKGFMTTENMMIVFGSLLFGAMSVGQNQAMLPDFGKSVESAQKIYKVIHRIPEIDAESNDGIQLDEYKGVYRFDHVKFKYPSRKGLHVLRDISLTINKDKSTALVGFSGCGKSTIMQLMERFYDPIEGTIFLDDYDIRTLNLQWYRNQLGIVSQEPILFNWSIIDNIAFGDHTKTQDIKKIHTAAISANIHEFISQLPEGYNTPVGSKGSLLSGGQKQRICLARALYRDPQLLLLDEATSSLDTESEKIVQEALFAAQEKVGSLTIAHRLATIQNSDQIFVLKNGKVIEDGTHNELYNKQGMYHALCMHSQR